MVVTSPFATNVGALVVNLANRGFLVKLKTENTIIGGQVLILTVADVRSKNVTQISEMLTEAQVTEIRDVAVIADIIEKKLKGAKTAS